MGYGASKTASKGDTRLQRWKKFLIALQARAGSDSRYDPKPNDTVRMTLYRIAKAIPTTVEASKDDTEHMLLCKILGVNPTRTGPIAPDDVLCRFNNYNGGEPTFTPKHGLFGIALDTSNGRVWIYDHGWSIFGELPDAPSTPTGLTLTGTDYEHVTFGWTNTGTGETSNEIQRSADNGGTWSTIATVAGAASSVAVLGESGGPASFRVRAKNAGGASAWSSFVTCLDNFTINESFVRPDILLITGGLYIQDGTVVDIRNAKAGSAVVVSDSNLNLTSLRLDSIASLDSITLTANSPLAEINLSSLETVNLFSCEAKSALTTLSLPSLTTCGSLYIRANSALTTLSLPELVSVTGGVDLSYNYLIQHYQFPKLALIAGELNLYGNSELVTVDFSVPITFLGNITSSYNNTKLANWNTNGMAFSGTAILLDFYGNNLSVSSVNHLLSDFNAAWGMAANGASIDVSGGTSAAPTVGPPDGIAAKANLNIHNIATTN